MALSSKPLHKVKGTTAAVVHPGPTPFHRNVGKTIMISFPYVGVQNDHMLLVFLYRKKIETTLHKLLIFTGKNGLREE